MVYILWSGDGESKWIEEIFMQKIDAEALMRKFKDQDKQGGRSYLYWIQEKAVQPWAITTT